jgi:DNA polymerase/3'-5' exonuclease PolX
MAFLGGYMAYRLNRRDYMLKRILIIAGILIVGITSFSLLNKPLEVDTAVANKEEQEPLVTKEEATLKMVKEKLNEKYGVDVKTTLKKELVIQVVGDEEYFNSVKKDIESIAKSVIKTSTLKDYSVVFERWDLFKMPEEFKKEQKELLHLGKTLMEGLKGYGVIGDIGLLYQKSITIQTSFKASDKDAHKLAIEIEETVNEILHSKELNSVSRIDSYEIIILNTNGKVVN